MGGGAEKEMSGFDERVLYRAAVGGEWRPADHFRQKQMDGNAEGGWSSLLARTPLSPRFSDRLKAVIFTPWESPNSVYECNVTVLGRVFSSPQDMVVWADWASCPPRSTVCMLSWILEKRCA